MAVRNGDGDGSSELAFIFIACARFIAITKGIGAAFVHTGTCGVVTIITSDLVGFGASTAVLVATSIGCESCVDGRVHDGCVFERIGTCTVAITTTTTCMVATSGGGAGSGASVCTCTGCEPCIATTKATGVACAHTGTFGDVTITTNDLVGSGDDGGELGVICTVFVHTSVLLAHAG
jgi:hypothetical protein